jgi:hypothetical protein
MVILQKKYWFKIFYIFFVLYLTLKSLKNISLNVKTTNETTFYENEHVLEPIVENFSKMQKFAIISASLESKDNYMFNLPMVCLSWRRIGFEPIVLIVNSSSSSSSSNPQADLTIHYLNLFKIRIIFIQSLNEYEKIVSMLVRIFAGLILNLSNNDILITSDSDLYPVNRKYYEIINNNNNESIYVWNAFCCGYFKHDNENYRMYPISSIAMSKLRWRQVMQLNNETNNELNGDFILKKIAQTFNGTIFIRKNNQISKGDQVWYLDQTWISINIKKYFKKKSENLIRMPYTGLRLDRAMSKHKWKKALASNFHSITDCHSFQDKIFKNWKLLNSLFLKLFNSNTNLLIKDYYLKYIKIIDA